MLSSTGARNLVSKWSRRIASPSLGAIRYLNVHEYVSMDIMKQHGVKVPECHVADSAMEAQNIFETRINKRKYRCCCPIDIRYPFVCVCVIDKPSFLFADTCV